MPQTAAHAGRREWTGLGALVLPVLVVSMDITVLFLALPSLSADLASSATELLWVTDIYTFLLAGLLIPMGALGDRVGRRRLLLTGGTVSSWPPLSRRTPPASPDHHNPSIQEESLMAQQPTYVFIAGNYASAHYWSWTTQELALRGHRSVAVELPGHGLDAHIPASYHTRDSETFATEPTPTAAITAEDYVAHVEDIVRRAHRNGPVILAGHASAGVILSLVANRVPDLLARLVYVSAFCCVDRATMADYVPVEVDTEEHRDFEACGAFVGNVERTGVIRINWLSGDPRHLAVFKALNAHTSTDDEARAILDLLQPDEPASLTIADARGHADTWGRVPRSYIRFARNRFLPPELQDRWIAEADRLTPDNPFDVHTVDVPHLAPRSLEVVDILDRLAATPG